ncbi:MAG: hypothetical protein IPI71_00030 [Methanolinea sp.]|nr:MAG: hypothetical protein IPI71_00030 [Methanolinea sp.]
MDHPLEGIGGVPAPASRDSLHLPPSFQAFNRTPAKWVLLTVAPVTNLGVHSAARWGLRKTTLVTGNFGTEKDRIIQSVVPGG